VRDLPPEDGLLTDKELEAVSGGFVLPTFNKLQASPTRMSIGPGKISGDAFAPPYVPVGPSGDG